MRYTLKQFLDDFPTDQSCLDFLFSQKQYTCPKGCSSAFYPIKNRRAYSCACGYQVYPTAGTIFHKSSTSLRNWFFAIFLMSQSKNGVSAMELQRQIGVTYKCAWRMQHKIRMLMKQDGDLLSGEVEIDEAYIGGKRKGYRGRHPKSKTPVVGAVERGGRIKVVVTQGADRYTLTRVIQGAIKPGTRLITDDHAGYHGIYEKGYTHDIINHSKYQYVLGDIHTNTIEGFWGQLKRSLRGTHISVSKKHLQAYLDEFAWRYNHRSSSEPLFELLIRQAGQHA